MSFLDLLGVFNYGLVLIYGLFLSVSISGGWENDRQRRLVFWLCPVFLLIQSPCWLFLGADVVKKLYPLIVHLPLVLILVLALKKPLGVAAVSVFTGYLCCQLPRWVDIAVSWLFRSPLLGEIAYTAAIFPLFFLLLSRFSGPAHQAMTRSRQSLLLFGGLPAGYYLFDYATTIYSSLLYSGIPALNELTPTVVILFYVLFLTAYNQETQKLAQAELELTAHTTLLNQAQREMEALRQAQTQTAIFRHDLRHHLNIIEGFLAADKPQQALRYIQKAQTKVSATAVQRFCDNETVNLLCSSFAQKAQEQDTRLQVEARLPKELPISDTELCALLSNGLENALNAAVALPPEHRWVRCFFGIRRDKLLLEIQNPYAGTVTMADGLPENTAPGHGFGCRSIRYIAQHRGGLYTFRPENGIFTLQVVLPLPTDPL